MLATVDLDKHQLARAGNMALAGECNRCGACCKGTEVPFPREDGQPDCKYLVMERVDGQPRARCDIYRRRPVGCALWPKPPKADEAKEGTADSVPPECGLRWERG